MLKWATPRSDLAVPLLKNRTRQFFYSMLLHPATSQHFVIPLIRNSLKQLLTNLQFTWPHSTICQFYRLSVNMFQLNILWNLYKFAIQDATFHNVSIPQFECRPIFLFNIFVDQIRNSISWFVTHSQFTVRPIRWVSSTGSFNHFGVITNIIDFFLLPIIPRDQCRAIWNQTLKRSPISQKGDVRSQKIGGWKGRKELAIFCGNFGPTPVAHCHRWRVETMSNGSQMRSLERIGAWVRARRWVKRTVEI